MSRASKDKVSFAGVFSTDESSQDSRIPTEVPDDEDDSPPLVKITGLSEPSPYRLAAQKFIEAQRKGLAPPPPNQSLPGLKVKSPDHSEAGPDDDSSESCSVSTVIYDPVKDFGVKLPDDTQEDDDTKTPVKKRVVTGFRNLWDTEAKVKNKRQKISMCAM